MILLDIITPGINFPLSPEMAAWIFVAFFIAVIVLVGRSDR